MTTEEESAGDEQSEVLPEWEVCIQAYGPEDEPGDARWEHYHPRAETKDEAREKAIEMAESPGIDAIIGISDSYDVVNIDGPFAADGGDAQ